MCAVVPSLVAGCAGTEKGSEQASVALSSTPAAVRAAISKVVNAGKIEKIEKQTDCGRAVYEVDFEVGELEQAAKITEGRTVIEQETETDPSAVPPAVLAGVMAKYLAAKVDDATEVKTFEGTTYKVSIEPAGGERELKLDASGKILEDSARGLSDKR